MTLRRNNGFRKMERNNQNYLNVRHPSVYQTQGAQKTTLVSKLQVRCSTATFPLFNVTHASKKGNECNILLCHTLVELILYLVLTYVVFADMILVITLEFSNYTNPWTEREKNGHNNF